MLPRESGIRVQVDGDAHSDEAVTEDRDVPLAGHAAQLLCVLVVRVQIELELREVQT